MKLLYLAQADIPSQTANSIHVMKMCDAFTAKGAVVSLWIPSSPGVGSDGAAYEYYGVQPRFRLEWLKAVWLLKPSYAYALQVWLKLVFGKEKYNLVFSRSLLGTVAALLAGAEVVLEVHEPMKHSGYLQGVFFDWIVRHKRFVKLVVITHALKDWHLEPGALPEHLIVVAPDGADVQPLPEVAVAQDANQSARFKAGYIGSLHQGKGMEIVLPLAKLLPNVDFHVVGGSGQKLDNWKLQAKGIDNLVFHGFMKPAAVHTFMASMDVLLAPNQRVVKGVGGSDIGRWTSPLKIFEYMAACRPIIASDLPVLREILEHERNCLLCAPEDVAAWADAICCLDDNRALGLKLAGTASNDLTERYSWQQRAAFLLGAIQ